VNKYELLKSLLTLLSKLSTEFRQFKVIEKSDKSPVTELDIINQYICENVIRHFYSKDKIVAEENTKDFFSESVIKEHRSLIVSTINEIKSKNFECNDKSACTWIIDPIDGTKGFIDNLCYSISISVVDKSSYLLSGIASIGLDKISNALPNVTIAATNNECVEFFDENRRVVEFSSIRRKKRTIAISRMHKSKSLYKKLEANGYFFIEIDSQAKYMAVLVKLADGYIREIGSCGAEHEFAWDHIAGIHLNQVLGGVTLDVNGEEAMHDPVNGLLYFDSLLITTANPVMHRELVSLFIKE
jgi:3'(2'), 5'-bisphosphate nucleotidase